LPWELSAIKIKCNPCCAAYALGKNTAGTRTIKIVSFFTIRTYNIFKFKMRRLTEDQPQEGGGCGGWEERRRRRGRRRRRRW
jgi:hypothetical protein